MLKGSEEQAEPSVEELCFLALNWDGMELSLPFSFKVKSQMFRVEHPTPFIHLILPYNLWFSGHKVLFRIILYS